MRVVLDADVLIGALDRSDAHHRRARSLFMRWRRQSVERMISAINLTEVLVAPAADATTLRGARQAIAALEVAVHAPSEAIAVEAARLRARHPISLADAYCLATAMRARGQIATFDERLGAAAREEGLTETG